MPNSARRTLFLILTVALVLRIGLVIAQPATSESIDRLPDQREYLALGQNLLHHGSLRFFDPRFKEMVVAFRMPGYPLFVAACGGSIFVARLTQCLIDVLSVLAIFLVTQKLISGNNPASLFAAAWVAFNPFYIFFSSLLLSETLFAAFLAWGLYFLLCFPQRRYAFGTLLLIAAAYVRPTGLLLMPLLAFAFALNHSARFAYRLSKVRWWCLTYCVPVTLFFSLELAICMSPWAWRNYKMLGVWIWTTTNSGLTFYDGFHPGASGVSDQRFIAEIPGLMSMNEQQRSSFFTAAARQWAISNWTQFPMLSLKKIARGWSPIPLSQDFGKPLYRIISASYSIPFDLLCAIGLFCRRLHWQTKLLIVTPAIAVTLGQVLSVGSLRYQMPAQAPLAVLAGVGLTDALAFMKFETRKSKRRMQASD